MKITTWNINSVRLRLPLLQKLIAEKNPDVICLQETKVVDELFPVNDIAALGYAHQKFSGMKSYNGVAILSRLPFSQTSQQNWCNKQDCRHVAVTLENGVSVHNFYVPAGGDIPDPDQNEKFAHKLQFVDEMTDFFKNNKMQKTILLGDLNIAPLEHDVWSHKQLLDVVSHTPVEVEKLTRMQSTLEWVDAVRHLNPEPEKIYSWWSYRNRDWKASNRGRRLDHIWVTPDLKKNIKNTQILTTARDWEKPSDHVPVSLEVA